MLSGRRPLRVPTRICSEIKAKINCCLTRSVVSMGVGWKAWQVVEKETRGRRQKSRLAR